MSGEDFFERFPKLRVKNRVDDRIKGRVGVAQPRQYLEGDVRDARLAECSNDVDAKERHPTYEEDAHDDTYSDGGFVIADVVWRTMVVVQVDV